MNPCPKTVLDFLSDIGIDTPIIESCLPRFEHFGDLLTAANREFNLTRLTDANDFWVKHIADSLALVELLPNLLDSSLRICDIGSGAGLPAIPLACLNPDLQIVALDGTRKKINFIDATTKQLDLKNVQALWGRAEELERKSQFKEAFDILTLRAVGAAPKILPKCRDLVDPELGIIVFYKTPSAIDKELKETKAIAAELDAAVDVTPVFDLPMDAGKRQFMIITPLN